MKTYINLIYCNIIVLDNNRTKLEMFIGCEIFIQMSKSANISQSYLGIKFSLRNSLENPYYISFRISVSVCVYVSWVCTN